MGQVTVRDLDDAVIDTLMRQAERNRRSLEQELREILTRAARPANGYGQRSLEEEVRDALERAAVPRDPVEWEELLRRVDATRAMTPKVLHQSDSTDLIREDRDSR